MKIVIDIPERAYKYAKKYINSSVLSIRDIDICMNAISNGALQTEPKAEWIPVSERLPKEDGEYLAYIINPYDEKLQYSMTCYYSAKIKFWFPDDECASDNVIAWMPLPKPYSEVEQ